MASSNAGTPSGTGYAYGFHPVAGPFFVALAFLARDLRSWNTLGLPSQAPATVLADETDVPALCRSLVDGALDGRPLFVLGGGSNVVVCPRPQYSVVRVALKGMYLWRDASTYRVVEAAAGESWHGFVAYCLAQGWPGLENLALIPGTVGAAPVQNIGAYGLELAECLDSVVAWDLTAGRRAELSASDCRFAYRDSLFRQSGPGRWLITRVRIRLPKDWAPRLDYPDLQHYFSGSAQVPDGQSATHLHPGKTRGGPTAQQIFDAVCAIRRRKLPDPALLPNAGSFFKNPLVSADQARALQARFPALRMYPQEDGRVKLAAGWLIEQAGWKGRCLGPVGMHARQALVLVNHGGAAAADVQALAQAVRRDVQTCFGVVLEQEPVRLD